MFMKTDIQIAQENQPLPIEQIAKKLGITSDQLELYGHYKAKLNISSPEKIHQRGKLILVTSINPTPAGEGKSTVTVGLGDALSQCGEKAAVVLREPSLGPTMGIKGGAAGGGYSQVVPMEDINLHFTGDMHALTTANNALAALIDNHIQQGNELQIDPRRITWKRSLDLNDRALRQVVIGLGGPVQGTPREDGFDITVASEMMAILCLATDLMDLKKRLSRIVIGFTYHRQPVTVHDLGVEGALTLLLKDAIKPNLVQTLEHTPALVHGGPFANIAHGCNSVIATKTALKLADYVITEAGFGADLGAEKFLDIKVPQLGISPDVVVVVATIRSLKMHGGVALEDLTKGENIDAVKAGFANLAKHLENLREVYHLNVVVALNEFVQDTKQEKNTVVQLCRSIGVDCVETAVWEKGGQGGIELARTVLRLLEEPKPTFSPLWSEATSSIEDKIAAVATRIYGAKNVVYLPEAKQQLKQFQRYGWDQLPVCIAKTQYSLSDQASLLGRPDNFEITVRSLIPKIGAGFIVALTGKVLTMPGLPKKPAALNMDIDAEGKITGLF